MKKIIAIILAALCLTSLCACGNEVEKEPVMQEETAEKVGIAIAQYLVGLVETGQEDQFKPQFYSAGGTFSSIGITLTGPDIADSAIDSLKTALEDTGEISFGDISTAEANVTSEEADITVALSGERKDANMLISIEGNQYEGFRVSNIATNVDYTMGEKMTKAFLNLVLGMGMAFSVLILISIVISFLPKIDALISGRGKKKEGADAGKTVSPAPAAPAVAAAPAAANADDGVISAVIAAAIAQYESETGASAGGYYVRSIRRIERAKRR
ncbi:MAG: OadG family protein [Lachnospiraceae bacterium]|nr:OadG family protein [Lachnospiraceae bacterium]